MGERLGGPGRCAGLEKRGRIRISSEAAAALSLGSVAKLMPVTGCERVRGELSHQPRLVQLGLQPVETREYASPPSMACRVLSTSFEGERFNKFPLQILHYVPLQSIIESNVVLLYYKVA